MLKEQSRFAGENIVIEMGKMAPIIPSEETGTGAAGVGLVQRTRMAQLVLRKCHQQY